MKTYETLVGTKLDKSYPAIVRVDGRAFSKYTRGFNKPFDDMIHLAMEHAAKLLCEEMQGSRLAYTQSDEITILFTAHDNPEATLWFDGKVQKIVSSAAAIATEAFNEYMDKMNISTFDNKRKRARFDARTFNLPTQEVNNCFIWRQQDAVRNSKQSIGHAHFSHKELMHKSTEKIVGMLLENGVVWDDLPAHYQRGICVKKEVYNNGDTVRNAWVIDGCIPLFSEDRKYVSGLIETL
jgi:tRNA(His) 5'-end guanylyltransferase